MYEPGSEISTRKMGNRPLPHGPWAAAAAGGSQPFLTSIIRPLPGPLRLSSGAVARREKKMIDKPHLVAFTLLISTVFQVSGPGRSAGRAKDNQRNTRKHVATPDNLYGIVEFARQCARSRPGANRGRSGSPLILDRLFQLEPSGEDWRVTFTEASPTATPHGRSFTVNLRKRLCNRIPLRSSKLPRVIWRASAAAILTRARQCATKPPTNSRGTCGSRLLLGKPTLSKGGGSSWVVTFAETRRTCRPAGVALSIADDASTCKVAPMD